MIPAWTWAIPVGLLVICTVLALETRLRVLPLVAGLGIGSLVALVLLFVGILH